MDFKGYPLEEYLDPDENTVNFPETIPIALAVCSKECGNVEFIVDGSTQVCQHCGKLMFRTYIRKYKLQKDQ